MQLVPLPLKHIPWLDHVAGQLSFVLVLFFFPTRKRMAGAIGQASWLLATHPGPLMVASPDSMLGFITSDPNPDLGSLFLR